MEHWTVCVKNFRSNIPELRFKNDRQGLGGKAPSPPGMNVADHFGGEMASSEITEEMVGFLGQLSHGIGRAFEKGGVCALLMALREIPQTQWSKSELIGHFGGSRSVSEWGK